jgi:hypothetical protein
MKEKTMTITVTHNQLAMLEKLLDKELVTMSMEEREYFSGDFHKDSVKKLYDNICKDVDNFNREAYLNSKA